MQVILELKEDKAQSILDVLKSMNGVTVKEVDGHKAAYATELKEAYRQSKRAEKGEVTLNRFDDLINEV